VLRFNADPEVREWQRLAAKANLKSRDRVLGLAPFRTTIELGRAPVELVGETEVWPVSNLSNQGGRFNLVQGRTVVRGTNPPSSFEVELAGQTIQMTPPAGVVVGLERLNRREPGSPTARSSVLRIYVPTGEVTVTDDSNKQTLRGPDAITFAPSGRWTDRSSGPIPSWVAENGPPAFDAQLGEQMLKVIRADQPIMKSLVEALENESRDIRRIAISAVRAMGDISYIVPLLSSEDSVSRRAAIGALRTYLAQGPETAPKLRKELIDYFGPEGGEQVEKLLVGYTTEEARDPRTYKRLVQQLGTTDEGLVGVRELSLDNLQTLTGRDDLGYDPAKPEGKGLKAWRDLSNANELRAAGSTASRDVAEEEVPPPPTPEAPAPAAKSETKKESSKEAKKEAPAPKKEASSTTTKKEGSASKKETSAAKKPE
jgi:hypothetical protein